MPYPAFATSAATASPTCAVADNPLVAPLAFMVIYAVVVAFSLPGGAIMTIAGGFLFGAVLGTAWVVLSATLGATTLICIVFIRVLKRRRGPPHS